MMLSGEHRLEQLGGAGLDLRLNAAHERRPAGCAQLARDGVLGVGQAQRAIATQPAKRLGISGASCTQQHLRVAPGTAQIDPAVHHTITSHGPAVRSAGQRSIARHGG